MDCIKKKVDEEIQRGWIGSNKDCDYHPSHFKGQDCTFCYCPFFPCHDPQLGKSIKSRHGGDIWDCSDCLFIHRTKVVKSILKEFDTLGIKNASDPRIKDVLPKVKEEHFRIGKAIMVLGATSDAGKSITAAALCRLLQRRGFLISPFKSQNMSLNSKVTRKGCEIAMIQALQAQAAGLKNTDHHMNPILLKPMGDTRSQVIVEGAPYADYDVEGYYSEFVPGPGKEIVKRNVDFLKERYDFIVMEGAGSPAEINIYDKDIANMRAAEVADASCILVVNVEWGGSYAYALGTIELIPEEDRKRIKGIILNNVRGDPSYMREGAEKIEEMCGVPVIGIVPHVDVFLPSEDSEAFRGRASVGNGTNIISVIKLPRIANFTDLDPLFLEDTTVRYVESPDQLEGSDAIVIPGTKNTVNDLEWLKETGLAEKILEFKGKVPILGICGGYQMMGKVLHDPNAIEGKVPGDYEGLGLFDITTQWDEYKKRVVQDEAILIPTGETVTGYELHMGMSQVNEKPLFKLQFLRSEEDEGAIREDEMLFGTYLHGCLDKPGFRKYFMSFVKHNGKPAKITAEDFDALLDKSIDTLTDTFESGMDMEKLARILEVEL